MLNLNTLFKSIGIVLCIECTIQILNCFFLSYMQTSQFLKYTCTAEEIAV